MEAKLKQSEHKRTVITNDTELFEWIVSNYNDVHNITLQTVLSAYFGQTMYVLSKPEYSQFIELLNDMFERKAKRIELPIFIKDIAR